MNYSVLIGNLHYGASLEFHPRNREGKVVISYSSDDDSHKFELSTEEEMELLKFLIKA